MAAIHTGGAKPAEAVRFFYTGVRPIVVKGGATGQVYRFGPGTSVRVHAMDAATMREIPGLRLQV